MTGRVQSLIEFHAATGLGNHANLQLRQGQARSEYLALTGDEREELAREALAEIEKGNNRFEQALCCLACFQPGSLTRYHRSLLEHRILYPGVIFFGANSEIAEEIIGLCDQGDCHNHALTALAWIGDEVVQATFAKFRWRAKPPSWVGTLFVSPHRYAEEAGWELTDQGGRHDLFSLVSRPLISPDGASGVNQTVKVGVPAEETCGWCNRKMVALLEFGAIESVVADQETGRVRVVTCHACTCFGPLFVRYGPDGKAKWHEQNEKPSYLPTASQEWDAFPEAPLVMTTETRHFLEAANWSMLPGVAFSQVGGLPTWIQDAEYPTCPDCKRKMPFVGQISNEDFMEYGEGIYYAFRCPRCNVTATCYQQT